MPTYTALTTLMAAAHDAKPFVISEVPDQDWVAHVRRELPPVIAGRFFVYGSHDADKIPNDPDCIPLLIEAAMAFGTGLHGAPRDNARVPAGADRCAVVLGCHCDG